MSGTDILSYEQLRDRLREMDALLASIRDEEVDAIVGKKNVVLLNSTRKIEEALRESRERFRAIYDASLIAIALFDPDGKMIHVNKSCLDLFGVKDVGDIINYRIFSQENMTKEIFDDILSGKSVNYQTKIDFQEASARGLMNSGNNGVLHIDVFVSPMLRQDGQTLSGFLMKISDITSQIKAEKHVAFQARLLESVDEAVVATDMADRITYWGRGAEKMLGESKQQMLGRPVGDLFFNKAFFDDMTVQEETASAEYEKLQADGSLLWISASLSLIKSADGNVEGVVGILRDITARKEAEETLRDREKQLETLYRKLILVQEEERLRVSREIHDSLGQNIISMQLEVEWLKNREPVAANKDVYNNLIALTVKVSDELQRICLGLRPLIMDKIGFSAAIKALVEEMEKNHDMAIKAMIMPIDESRLSSEVTINLYRILQESLVNIVRHANTKTASVSLCEEGDEIVLDVKDEGCGIVEDKLSRRRHFGILGMIERANMSGGKFKIVTTPGKGTRIRVSVPIG